jgi:predicted GNAT superfamily acetyltransferase
MSFEIQDVVTADLDTVMSINEASVPAMNSIPLEEFEWFRQNAAYFRVALCNGEVAGFLICLSPQADYDSPNLRWLNDHYREFLYIDRIAVGSGFQRRGLGRSLYDDALSFARGEYELLACEVNIRPRNQQSIDFHETYGFETVGTQDNGYVEVQFMVKQV